jgi:DNA-binding NarL/FixJ family response regulator
MTAKARQWHTDSSTLAENQGPATAPALYPLALVREGTQPEVLLDSQQMLQTLEEGLRQMSTALSQAMETYHALVASLRQSSSPPGTVLAAVPFRVLTEADPAAHGRMRGRVSLTGQEVQILRLAAEGLNNRDIGVRQFWSEITIKRKIAEIYRKLEVKNRAQAVAEGIRLGII